MVEDRVGCPVLNASKARSEDGSRRIGGVDERYLGGEQGVVGRRWGGMKWYLYY